MLSVFTNLVVRPDRTMYNSITTTQLEQFERSWLMYYIAGKRYGQAFCEHFKIGYATPLYHFRDDNISRRWVNDNYLQK